MQGRWKITKMRITHVILAMQDAKRRGFLGGSLVFAVVERLPVANSPPAGRRAGAALASAGSAKLHLALIPADIAIPVRVGTVKTAFSFRITEY